MKIKLKRAAAPVFLFVSFVSIFLAAFCSTVSSMDLPSDLTTSEVQKTQDGRDISSESYGAIHELLDVTTPKEHIGSRSTSTHDNHDFEDNEAVGAKDCTLTAEVLQQMKSAGKSEWIITNKTLESLHNDPQRLIQCTEPGDRVIFKLRGVQKFKRTLVVLHKLEFISDAFERNETEVEYRDSTSFTCPDSGPFLIVNATNITTNGFIVENCTKSSGRSTIVVKTRSNAVFENMGINNCNNRVIYAESQSIVSVKNSHFSNDGTSGLYGGVIYVASNVALTISNSTFFGNAGYEGGVLYGNGSNFIIVTGSSFTENNADRFGGAICLRSSNTLEVTNSTMSQNNAVRDGGAIHLESGNTLEVTNSTMSKNKASYNGGAIYLYSHNTLEVINSTMSKNNAVRDGGAIYFFISNNSTVVNSEFLGNKASEFGGAIDFGGYHSATVLNSMFTRNKAIWHGGALRLGINCYINISKTSMIGNDAELGGGAYLERSNVAIVSRTYFSNNSASRGGVVYTDMECDISIYASNFTKNHAEFGGCLYGVRSSTKIETSTFWNNSASQDGGCFFIESYTVELEANTFNLNQAKKDGGAIHASSNTFLHLKEDQVVSNSAVYGGGIALISDSRILCESCTFRNNTADGGGGVYIESRMTQIIIAQFGKSAFLYNYASQYGGGMVIKTFGSRSFDCSRVLEQCSRVLLIKSSFVGNIANHSGSAILATTPKNVFVACEAPSWFYYRKFISVSNFRFLQNYFSLKIISNSSSPCISVRS